MAGPIDYYFDFSSPYGYLVCDDIDAFGAKHGREVVWRPFLLGTVFALTGQTPLVDQPIKGDYYKRDWERFSKLLGLPYQFPDPFPISTVAAARAFYWLWDQDPKSAKDLSRALFRAYFGENRNIPSAEAVIEVAGEQGLDTKALAAALQDQAVKDRLRAENDAAIARGVFGSPICIVDGEMFWGADRLWQVKRWIEQGGW